MCHRATYAVLCYSLLLPLFMRMLPIIFYCYHLTFRKWLLPSWILNCCIRCCRISFSSSRVWTMLVLYLLPVVARSCAGEEVKSCWKNAYCVSECCAIWSCNAPASSSTIVAADDSAGTCVTVSGWSTGWISPSGSIAAGSTSFFWKSRHGKTKRHPADRLPNHWHWKV